jgi:hypothetical protein
MLSVVSGPNFGTIIFLLLFIHSVFFFVAADANTVASSLSSVLGIVAADLIAVVVVWAPMEECWVELSLKSSILGDDGIDDDDDDDVTALVGIEFVPTSPFDEDDDDDSYLR